MSIIPPSSVESSIGHHDTRSIIDIAGEYGLEIAGYNTSDTSKFEDAIIKTGQAIEVIGNDEDNQAEFVFEQSDSSMHTDVDLDDSSMSGSEDNSGQYCPEVESQIDIVFRAIADANPEYGMGGGTQYFIQNASELKAEGRLILQPYQEVLCFDQNDLSSLENWGVVVRGSSYSIDTRDLLEEDADELCNASINNTFGSLFDMPNSVNDKELEYLDNSTIADSGLTKSADEFNVDSKSNVRESHEDWRHPHGNQEDTMGKIQADSWSNPEELTEGDTYYQLTPVFSDGRTGTLSSYFTDAYTIESCRNREGKISLFTILQKLQIEPKKETIRDENGMTKEVYISKYVLSSYVYSRNTDKSQ